MTAGSVTNLPQLCQAQDAGVEFHQLADKFSINVRNVRNNPLTCQAAHIDI
eukprot:m.88333 g.88333  ORF g.88333 m.88333 type:complete len:51 (+) comp11633_c0_seq2:1074-1226(+)